MSTATLTLWCPLMLWSLWRMVSKRLDFWIQSIWCANPWPSRPLTQVKWLISRKFFKWTLHFNDFIFVFQAVKDSLTYQNFHLVWNPEFVPVGICTNTPAKPGNWAAGTFLFQIFYRLFQLTILNRICLHFVIRKNLQNSFFDGIFHLQLQKTMLRVFHLLDEEFASRLWKLFKNK